MSSCAICYEDFNNDTTVKTNIPCCERDESTVKFCFRCIEIMCSNNNSGIGTCPRCTGPIMTSKDNYNYNKSEVIIPGRRLRCRYCNHTKPATCFNHLPPRNITYAVCSVCEISENNPLRYECQSCHNIQRIYHPMYRYQETPTDFGGHTWACHQLCYPQPCWRIIPEDIDRIPHEEIPQRWNEQGGVNAQQEREFERIRTIRRNESMN